MKEARYMEFASFTKLPELEYSGKEAFNTLNTNLSFSGRDKKVIMVTSNFQLEGKSFVSIYLAQSLASTGNRVLLIDADLRASSMTASYAIEYSGRTPHYGLSHYLAGICEYDDIFYATDNINVDYLPVGRNVMNSLSLLATGQFKELVNSAALSYDYVIIDSPPLGLIIDGAEIAKSCDGAIIVAAYKKARKRSVRSVKRQLELANCPILGVVLNKVDLRDASNKKYYGKEYFSSYYGKTE